MRTDPRAAEVRMIVERVFARFLAENGRCERAGLRAGRGGRRKAEPAAAGKGAARRASCLAGESGTEGPRTATFPRLFRPESGLVGGWDNDEETSEFESSVESCATVELDETVLIDRGRYVARTYRAAGMMAMWLIAVGIVQFYDDQGNMLGTVNLFRTLRPERMAS